MKAFNRLFAAVLMIASMAFLTMPVAMGDAAYPWTNPTYTPTASGGTQTFTTTGDYSLTMQNLGTVGIEITGTCTSLAAVAQISIDGGTTWLTVNVYPITTSTVTAAASIAAAGAWRINAAGASMARIHITTNAATCKVTMQGTSQAFTNLF